jgi:hypothetical protein
MAGSAGKVDSYHDCTISEMNFYNHIQSSFPNDAILLT